MSEINKAMVAAMADISKLGIAKLSRNTMQNYQYRGVEAAMNELSPILVRHGITVSPKYTDLAIGALEREGKSPLRIVTLKGAFTFSVDDGSSITSEVYGEAMDSGDKAVVKAQSVAFRTALFQQFVVPTMAMDPEEGQEESDGEGSEIDAFRAAAMQGAKSLKAHFDAHKPTDAFWKRHGEALKAAAKKADAEPRQ